MDDSSLLPSLIVPHKQLQGRGQVVRARHIAVLLAYCDALHILVLDILQSYSSVIQHIFRC